MSRFFTCLSIGDVNVLEKTAVFQKKSQLDQETDVDHITDLQLGGLDTSSNLWGLNKSVNRSLGSQVSQRIRNLPAGTPVNHVYIDHQ